MINAEENQQHNTHSGVNVSAILNTLKDVGYSNLQESDIKSFTVSSDDVSVYNVIVDHTFTDTQIFPELKERIDVENLNSAGTSNLSIKPDDLDAGYQTTATITMIESGAGYNNTLGAYTIGDDGSINAVEFAFTNVKDGLTEKHIAKNEDRIERYNDQIGRNENKIERLKDTITKYEGDKLDLINSNDKNSDKKIEKIDSNIEKLEARIDKYENAIDQYEASVSSLKDDIANLQAQQQYTYALSGDHGDKLGTFIIADGDRVNKDYNNIDLENGSLQFLYDFGGANERTANISDSAQDVKLVYTSPEGVETVIGGHIYHSTERGASTAINPDGAQHTVSGLANADDTDTLRIGFEDLKNLGDADFNDVVFDITINQIEITTQIGDQDETYNGGNFGEVITTGNGNDVIFAEGGNDIINSKSGRDTIYGGAGADRFIFEAGLTANDLNIIRDFDASEGDQLDFTQMITGFIAGSSNIADYIRITDNGIDSVVRIDANGGRDDFSLIVARLDGVTNLNVFELFNNNNLLVTGAEIIDARMDPANIGSMDSNPLYGGDGDDVIYGGDGDDVLYGGAGDDILFGNAGRDVLTGDNGADTFVFGSSDGNQFDVIRDFDAAEGDVIDLSALITGFNPGVSNIADFIRFTEGSNNSFLRVDIDGGRDDFSLIVARLDGLTGLDVFDLFNNGNLAVTGNNTLTGTDAADALYGFDGDDIFIGGLGRDSLRGGTGADTFKFTDTTEFDLVRDFNAADGDVLDITEIIDGFDPASDAIGDFVLITEGGANSFVRIDADGAANGQDFTTIVARLDGVTGLNAETLYQDGNIIL